MAEQLKELANQQFKEGSYYEAVRLYTEALALLPEPKPEYLTNRAAAHFQLGDFVAAKQDAERAISLDSTSVKGYWRLAECERVMNHYQNSITFYKQALEHKPGNKKIVSAIRDVQNLIQLNKPKTGLDSMSLLRALHSVQPTFTTTSRSTPSLGFPGYPFMSPFGSAGNAPDEVDETERESNPSLPEVTPDAIPLYKTTAEASNVYTPTWLQGCYDYIIRDEKTLHSNTMKDLVSRAAVLLNSEPTCLEVKVAEDERLAIVGDIHGSLRDMRALQAKLFSQMADESKRLKIIFLGDYVDRGAAGHNIITFLLCFKLCYPDRVFLIRGNHETISMNNFFGYQSQVENLYGTKSGMFGIMSNLFAELPLSCLVNGEIFCAHGGAPISADVHPLEISKRYPTRQVEMNEDLVSELLWSDPSQEEINEVPCNAPLHCRPSHRGVGFLYDHVAFKTWAKKHNIRKMFRAHEAIQPIGVRRDFGEHASSDHDHYTVFSSSQYMGMPNIGSFVLFTPGLKNQEAIMLN